MSQPAVSQPPISQPLASQPKDSSFAGEWEDSPNFAVAAELALSELRDGITVAEWMARHPGATKIDRASIGIGGECVILRKTATLADGAQVARLVVQPSASVFSGRSTEPARTNSDQRYLHR